MGLYNIKETYLEFLQKVESGEIPEEAIKDTLESLEGELEDKIDNLACYVKQLIAESKAIKEEAEKLLERASVKKNKAESIKNYLQNTMIATGLKKIETSRNVLSFRKSESIQILDEKMFMLQYPEFCKSKTEITISKTDIKESLKDGVSLDGVWIQVNENFQLK